jgi:hypothetical protein
MDQTRILNRAFSAYLTTDGADAAQPSESQSGELELGGLRYVVLRNGPRVLAVYRIKHNGSLRRMKRWPLGLGCASAPSTTVPNHHQSNINSETHV